MPSFFIYLVFLCALCTGVSSTTNSYLEFQEEANAQIRRVLAGCAEAFDLIATAQIRELIPNQNLSSIYQALFAVNEETWKELNETDPVHVSKSFIVLYIYCTEDHSGVLQATFTKVMTSTSNTTITVNFARLLPGYFRSDLCCFPEAFWSISHAREALVCLRHSLIKRLFEWESFDPRYCRAVYSHYLDSPGLIDSDIDDLATIFKRGHAHRLLDYYDMVWLITKLGTHIGVTFERHCSLVREILFSAEYALIAAERFKKLESQPLDAFTASFLRNFAVAFWRRSDSIPRCMSGILARNSDLIDAIHQQMEIFEKWLPLCHYLCYSPSPASDAAVLQELLELPRFSFAAMPLSMPMHVCKYSALLLQRLGVSFEHIGRVSKKAEEDCSFTPASSLPAPALYPIVIRTASVLYLVESTNVINDKALSELIKFCQLKRKEVRGDMGALVEREIIAWCQDVNRAYRASLINQLPSGHCNPVTWFYFNFIAEELKMADAHAILALYVIFASPATLNSAYDICKALRSPAVYQLAIQITDPASLRLDWLEFVSKRHLLPASMVKCYIIRELEKQPQLRREGISLIKTIKSCRK